MRTDPHRVALIEITPDEPERRFRTEAFPFIQGFARTLGVETFWLAIGTRYEPTLCYRLEQTAFARLLEIIANQAPVRLVCNERLVPEQWEALGRASQDGPPRFCFVGEELFTLFWFLRELFPSATDNLDFEACHPEQINPDFERGLLTQASGAISPLIRIVAGIRCRYRRPTAGNPHFRDLGLNQDLIGCSFCGSSPHALHLSDPLGFAIRQMEAAHRQPLPPGHEHHFELTGAVFLARLDALAGRLINGSVRHAELALAPRIDELMDARETILASLPLMAENALALKIHTTGVENFSPAENLRLNKGLTADQVHAAAAFLKETGERWPRTFRFPDSAGLSMILFTPWTTPEDLRINIGDIARCPMIVPSRVIGTRLQLFPGRPITRLAEKDGLIAPSPDDHFYNSGCIVESSQAEIPWRFAHPGVGVLYRLCRRLSSDRGGVPADDSEWLAVEKMLAGQDPRRIDHLEVLRWGVRAIESNPDIRSVEELLSQLPPPLLSGVSANPTHGGSSGRQARPEEAVRFASILAGLLASSRCQRALRLLGVSFRGCRPADAARGQVEVDLAGARLSALTIQVEIPRPGSSAESVQVKCLPTGPCPGTVADRAGRLVAQAAATALRFSRQHRTETPSG